MSSDLQKAINIRSAIFNHNMSRTGMIIAAFCFILGFLLVHYRYFILHVSQWEGESLVHFYHMLDVHLAISSPFRQHTTATNDGYRTLCEWVKSTANC